MTTQAQQNFLIKTLSRGCMAEMKEIVDQCDDKETAQPIYRELMRLAHKLSQKHDFKLTKKDDDMGMVR